MNIPRIKSAGGIVFCASLLFILAVTLFPFNFASRGPSAKPFLATGIENGWGMLTNVFLFVPLGFGAAAWLMRGGGLRTHWALAITAVSGLGLSSIVELLQGFVAGRSSSLVDIECNAIGAILGFACFYSWERRDVRPILLGYMTFAYLISVPLQRDTLLSNWDENYPLLLGNELTGDRPWRGGISQLHLVDRAISEEEARGWFNRMKRSAEIGSPVLASFYFTGASRIGDRMGNLPDLVFRSKSGAPEEAWMESESPVVFLNRRIAANSKFTLAASFTAGSTDQKGPARIISISRNPGLRNLTVGQEGRDLVFRLRTPMTGENGVNPALTVPGIFAAGSSHDLIAIYDGSILTLYVDEISGRHTLALSPGAAAASYFKPATTALFSYKLAFYIAVFFPFGILISIVLQTMASKNIIRLLLALSAATLASLFLEAVLVAASGKAMEWRNFFLGILVIGGTFILFQSIELIRTRPSRQRLDEYAA